VKGLDDLTEEMRFVLFDPQTSGGLLAAVPHSVAQDAIEALAKRGVEASVIGFVDGNLDGVQVLA
jgi:selenide,water dikinase